MEKLYENYVDGIVSNEEYIYLKKEYDDQYRTASASMEEIRQKKARINDAFAGDNKWLKAIEGIRSETELSQQIVDKMIIEAITSYTRPYGFIPKLRFVKNHESTITCVRNNMGVAIVDEWVWAKGAEDIRWIPFRAKDIVSIARMSARESEQNNLMEKILSEVISEQEAARKTM